MLVQEDCKACCRPRAPAVGQCRFEGGELQLCESDAAFPTEKALQGLASALTVGSLVWGESQHFLHGVLLVVKVANVLGGNPQDG